MYALFYDFKCNWMLWYAEWINSCLTQGILHGSQLHWETPTQDSSTPRGRPNVWGWGLWEEVNAFRHACAQVETRAHTHSYNIILIDYCTILHVFKERTCQKPQHMKLSKPNISGQSWCTAPPKRVIKYSAKVLMTSYRNGRSTVLSRVLVLYTI